MKLKELNEAVAKSCDVRGNVVTSVQNETFRQIRVALDKGEKVVIPDFGMFVVREVPGEGGGAGKKMVRFRERGGDDKKAKKEAKKNKDKPQAAGQDDDGDDGED